MSPPIHHVLVPVDPNDKSQWAQDAALNLALGSGALITLMHVRECPRPIAAGGHLDAVSSLHEVMMLPAHDNAYIPAHREERRHALLPQLQAMQAALAAEIPDHVQIRVVCREGDAVAEVRAYIDEAGVDVVVVQSPQACKSPLLRRITRALEQRCSCQVQIVCPPNRIHVSALSRWAIIWELLRARLLRSTSTAGSPARSAPDAL